MKVIDHALLRSYSERTRCQWCGRDCERDGIVAHHVFHKGFGGGSQLDVPELLLAVDFRCHLHLEVHVPQAAQLELLAHLWRTTVEKISEFAFAILRLDKSASVLNVQALRLEIFGRAA